MAEPLVGDAAGKILEDAEFEIHPWIKWAWSAAHQPAIPVGVLLADGQNVRLVRRMPARSVEIPALADGDDLTQLAFADHVPDLMLIGITQPLRPQLHHPIALQRGIPRQLGVFERIGHGLFAVAILAGAHHFSQKPGMLMVAGSDHHRVQLRVGQQLLGVLKGFGPHAE